MILWVWGRWIWTRTLFTTRTTAPSLPLLFNSSQCLRLDDFMIKSISRLEIEVTWFSKNSNKIFVLFSDTLVDMIPARNIPFKLVEMGFNLKWWCWCQENKRWKSFLATSDLVYLHDQCQDQPVKRSWINYQSPQHGTSNDTGSLLGVIGFYK